MRIRASFTRRQIIKATYRAAGFLGGSQLFGRGPATVDPWSSAELIQPAELAGWLKNKTPERQLRIICVTFPVLYRQKHIPTAVLAGPASKPEGVAQLHSVLAELPTTASVVLYCGCCPMAECPNVRPAYIAAKQRGFRKLYVLNLPTNLHTDWVIKGYPVGT